MARHSFDYTYEVVGKRTAKTEDGVLVVSAVMVNVTAVDKADSSQSMTLQEQRELDHHAILTGDLPDNFIACRDLTDADLIRWFKAGIPDEQRDGFYTWQIYGYAEMDGT